MNTRKSHSLLLFFIVIFFEIAITAYLILDKRMVGGHDGFLLFSQQWYVHNSKIVYGQMPLWTPYVEHGFPMTWWYIIQGTGTMSANALLLFSHWLKSANFLPIFYGEFFVDKMILLIGVWLLGQRYFSSIITLFFVATCVMSSCVVLSQYGFTLKLFCALPLIVYLFHRFFDTGRGGWFFAATYLFFLQTIGNVAYFMPIFSLAIFVYFFSYFYSQKQILAGSIQKILGYKYNIRWATGALVLLYWWISLMYLAKDPEIVYTGDGRNDLGGVGLDVFMTYGGFTDLCKWWDMLLRISPQIDFTVYMGMLGLPLVLVGAFCSKNENKYPFIWGTVILLLFSLATPISVLCYYFWPLMKFYRHIAYIAPLIKLYLCFLAGFGFEQIFIKDTLKENKAIFRQGLFVAGALYLNSLFLCQLSIHEELGTFMVYNLAPTFNQFGDQFSSYFISKNLYNAAYISFLLSIVVFIRNWIPPSRYPSYLLIFLILHCMDVYSYAFQQVQLRSFSLNSQEYASLNFRSIPFVGHRLQDEDKVKNSRQEIVKSLVGVKYDSTYNFTLIDPVKTTYRSDFCLRPLKELTDIKDGIKPSVFLKLVGATEGRIQFFSNAYPVNSHKDILSALKDKSYTGNVLLYQSPDQVDKGGVSNLKDLHISQNDRLKIPYKVIYFSPNEIELSIDTLKKTGVWMEYCDVWHPSWKVQVNGKPQKIYIGNLAYKAMVLEKGKNIVRLYYEANFLNWLYNFFMASSFVFLIFAVGLLFV